MSGNFQGLAMGVAGILGGALVLIVGLNMSDIVISSINETGARVACYSGEGDIPIDNAGYAKRISFSDHTIAAAGTTFAATPGDKLPTSGEIDTNIVPGGANSIVGLPCLGQGYNFDAVTLAATTIASGTTLVVTQTAFDTTGTTIPARSQGTIRYQLEVYGATGLNNIFSLLYFIVLVMIALGMVGGGAMIARDSVRGMSG